MPPGATPGPSDIGGTPRQAESGRIDPATGVRIETAPTPRPRRQAPTPRPRTENRPQSDNRGSSEPVPAPERPRTTDARETAPERRAAEPERAAIVLPEGTQLPVRLVDAVATDTVGPEQEVLAELSEAVRHNGQVVLPAGSEVMGHVVIAQRSGRVKGRARLVLDFDTVRVRNRSYQIESARWDVTAESSRSRDAKIAGGAAAAGAIIGAITGGAKGAAKGAVLGGAAGGAAVLVTRGNEVELPAGVTRYVVLTRPLRIE